MPIFGSSIGIALGASSSVSPPTTLPGITFIYNPATSSDPFTTSSIGSISAMITSVDQTGSSGELIFRSPSPQNNESTGSIVLRLGSTGSNNEPRVGIGFEGNEKPVKAFEVKTKKNSTEGTELLLRSSRIAKGAEGGDSAGSIRFSVDSASFEEITTTGSVAIIDTQVTTVEAGGVTGDLIFKAANTARSAPNEIMRIRGDNNRVDVTGSFHTTGGTQLGTSTSNTHTLTGSVNIHGDLGVSGDITVNDITANDITASSLTLSDSFQYNNVILESTESAVSAGTTVLGEFPTASYKSVHVDYLISAGSTKARAGHLISTWKGTDVTFTDVSAKSIGDTSDAEFSVVLNGANADLKITSSNSYDVSISSRAILNGSSFALGGGNISTSPFPFTGSAVITGSLDITGSIIPGGNGVYDLGDVTHFWRTASIEHIVTLGETIEFRDPSNKNTKRGTLKLDDKGGLKIRGSSDVLTTVSASHGHFTGNLAISGISNVSASIAAAAASGGDSSNRLAPSDTGSLLTTASVSSNIITFTKGDASTFDLTIDTGSTVIPSTYFNSSLLETQNITKNFNYTSSLNVVEITSSVEGAIIDYRLTNLDTGSRVGTFMYAHDGTTLSYNDITIPGAGIGADPILSATLTGSIVSIDIENAAGFNFSGFAKKFSKLENAVPVADPNIPYLLDAYPSQNTKIALSVRKLSQFYTGSCMRVRRDSDNNGLDIGFDVNGNLDTEAIETYCGSANGYVEIWYDQSGNNYNATQSIADAQPKIYNGTSVLTENGLPQLDGYGRGGFTTSVGTLTQPYTIATVLEANTSYVRYLGNNGNIIVGASREISFLNTTLSPNNAGLEQFLLFGVGNGSSGLGVTRTNTTDSGVVSVTNTTNLDLSLLFSRYNSAGSNNRSYMQEFVVWDEDRSNNRIGIQSNINNYYSIYDTGLLEDYSGASAAYSVRQLSTSATSSMNIRRASDNTEQIIGFTSAGDLDTGSIETFCNGTECYVDTWYDQSGNGNHAEQTSATKQPLIYSASAVITENNKPALNFDGSDDVFKKQFGSAIAQPGHVYITATNNTTNFNDYIVLFSGYNDANTRWQTEVRITTGYLSMYAGSSNTSTTAIGTAQSLHNNYYSGSDSDYRLNGTSITTGNAGTFSTDGLTIGARFNEIYHWDGTMQEFIIWPTSQSNAIETNINSYFNIY